MKKDREGCSVVAWKRFMDSSAGSLAASTALRALSTPSTTYSRSKDAVAGAQAPSILRMPSFLRLRQRAAASFSACDSAAKGALKPLAFLPLRFFFA